MAENDKLKIRATNTDNKVAIHRIHSTSGFMKMVGYYSPDEAEDIGMRIIREAGKARERIDIKAKKRNLKAVA